MMHVLTRSEVIGHSSLVSAMRMARVRLSCGCLPLYDLSILAVTSNLAQLGMIVSDGHLDMHCLLKMIFR